MDQRTLFRPFPGVSIIVSVLAVAKTIRISRIEANIKAEKTE